MHIGGDVSTYKIRHGSQYLREDADGRVHILARAGASATANVPKILSMIASASNPLVGVGYFATAVYSCLCASATAAQSKNYFVGIPVNQVPSSAEGWFQIGGPYIGVQYTSQDFYINCGIKWSNATFLCSVSGGQNVNAATDSVINTFGISLSSISQGTYDWYLFGKPFCGLA